MEYFFSSSHYLTRAQPQPQFMPAEFKLAKFSHSLKSYFSDHYLFIYLPNKKKIEQKIQDKLKKKSGELQT